ncbi:saccharopine dehydrogenase NADP-binding domain-containing protein [Propionicimonas sp.]|uniref:saccharopine dehydrogenase family protein n=1 Tax=Propionicimonas sp. TaxID=1955623 RepID=UPI0017E836FB|nr:saccharopine dehydrogenase NADP-binding domain-containing protein [Propionicimonas sp.]MBU3975538.1 saccharopine dehydrogenase NADP-binding domain-containing protein [Actinomycetota bacterium]MBA3020057.1 hypothetical protein [Propionicimonas sp.]MBU3986313.1 saccharopine dehydrogenase NADP-binding domain-containing protein [Actinomycetota bacterium]MBU4007882.1 saccharopine dehydrogenase NADP-binding domain-containing protein [Actinomycetota bacterium]MBU4064140.1 saccharopine dehydrogenas
MRIIALGASGKAGAEIVRLLATSLSADDELVLAGRDPGRLAATKDSIVGPPKVTTALAEASDQAAVGALVTGADLVVVTVSRPDLVGALARTVLAAGADWFDTLLSGPTKLNALRELEPEIIKAGRCFVTDGGFHPGLPAVLVRWAAEQLDELIEADVSAGMRIDWQAEELSTSTIEEMLDEFADFDLTTWIDGERRAMRWSECPTVDFSEPIGRKLVVPMPLAEMDALPLQYPSLRRCGFYICGFGPAMDYLVLPLLMGMARVPGLRSPTIRLTRWSMARLASKPPPHRLVVQTEAIGQRSGRPAAASAKVGGQDGYLLTAAPVVACIRRVLDGSIRTPGLHLQAQLVQPGPFLTDLAELGLEVETGVVPLD